jgi:hypothetical protein
LNRVTNRRVCQLHNHHVYPVVNPLQFHLCNLPVSRRNYLPHNHLANLLISHLVSHLISHL